MIFCHGCGRAPGEIREYVELAETFDVTREQYVLNLDHTFNGEKFLCPSCYLLSGMPETPIDYDAIAEGAMHDVLTEHRER